MFTATLKPFRRCGAEMSRQHVSSVYNLGDTMGHGPNPIECLDLVKGSAPGSTTVAPASRRPREQLVPGVGLDDADPQFFEPRQVGEAHLITQGAHRLLARQAALQQAVPLRRVGGWTQQHRTLSTTRR